MHESLLCMGGSSDYQTVVLLLHFIILQCYCCHHHTSHQDSGSRCNCFKATEILFSCDNPFSSSQYTAYQHCCPGCNNMENNEHVTRLCDRHVTVTTVFIVHVTHRGTLPQNSHLHLISVSRTIIVFFVLVFSH